ncbi:MAG: M20/M25/M40 family metallo-hydrolase [Thermaerobacterales bacterium]
MKDVFRYIDENADRFVSDLQRLVRQPSNTPDVADCIRCADILAEIMKTSGCEPEVMPPAPGIAPILYHDARSASADARTMIGYAHYDVKPADPVDEWTHEPWGAEIVDDVMYGRGVVDNKSGSLAFVYAVEAFRAVRGAPPVHVKMVIEGEEETGSEHLESWALNNRRLLDDVQGLHCLDGHVEASNGMPRVTIHGRALLYIELRAKGPSDDVHSGRAHFVTNPAWRLVGALSTIKDPNSDRILVDGWYDRVKEPDADDEAFLDSQMEGFDEAAIQKQYGTEGRPFPGGRRGRELLHAFFTQPTASICGIHAGFTTPGELMTIVPSTAIAKLDFRCPPDLDPEELVGKLRAHLDRHGYDDVEIAPLNVGRYPWRAPFQSAMTQACIRASREVFGRDPDRVGPSAPEGIFAHHFGIPAILTGFGTPDCNIHAPDERLPINQYIKGIKYAAAIMEEFARG